MNINEKAIIYYIEYEGKPIYIGSTNDLENRQKGHNNDLRKAILESGSTKLLYNFLCNKVKKIKLLPIKEVYNDVVLLSEYRIEWRRYIEEEKAIRLCFNKGIQLLNMVWPCKSWINNSGKLIKRDTAEDLKIQLNTKYKTSDALYLEIYNFIKMEQSLKEDNIIVEVEPVYNEYIKELFSEELVKHKINFKPTIEPKINVEDYLFHKDIINK